MHEANNFPFVYRELHKIKAFSIKNAKKCPIFGYIFVDFLTNARDFDELSSNRLKRLF